jgi:hypothetical protein
MLKLFAALLLVVVVSGDAEAQTQRPSVRDAAMSQCRNASHELIGLTRAQLRARCGPWLSSQRTADSVGEIETVTYGTRKKRLFSARLYDGVVTVVNDLSGRGGDRQAAGEGR